MDNLNFRHIEAADLTSINNLLTVAFPDTHSNRAVVKLRKNVEPIMEYSMLAETESKQIVAQIYFYRVKLPSAKVVPMLGPLSVIPKYRGKGLGNAMVEYGLHQLSGREDGVLIVGPQHYYAEYGFDIECVKGLSLDGEISPFEFMGLEFEEGVFSCESGRISPV